MYSFVANNSYNGNQTMHKNEHRLVVVHEYLSYGEK